MSNVLICGAGGFVGHYVDEELKKHGYNTICADVIGAPYVYMNVMDEESIIQVLNEYRIDYIIHLAGFSSAKNSWDHPADAVAVNVNGTINLLSAVRKVNKDIKILLIGSSDQYGGSVGGLLLNENSPMNPKNPYAVSKLAQENMALVFAEAWGLKVVMSRSFNHIGPGQRRGFVTSDFAYMIANAEINNGIDTISVGNLDVSRDFTDVRDVASAYRLLIEKGRCGEVYNVGSGHSIYIRELLEKMLNLSKKKLNVVKISDWKRPIDTDIVMCDNSKIVNELHWDIKYDIDSSIEAILEHWRRTVRENKQLNG